METMNVKILGTRIKERREELHMSAEELAEKTNRNKSSIHRYENGDFKRIRCETVKCFADVLRVNPAWLVGASEDKYLSPEVSGARPLSEAENELLDKFRRLNAKGQEYALIQLGMMSSNPEFTEKKDRTASLA